MAERKGRGEFQPWLPGLPPPPPSRKALEEIKKKNNPMLWTAKGKRRSPKGIERWLKKNRKWNSEEAKQHKSYEASGKDETDGKKYW